MTRTFLLRRDLFIHTFLISKQGMNSSMQDSVSFPEALSRIDLTCSTGSLI
jgi:hypothetical protein